MDFAGKRVLVTGAGGFLGSHLCEALLERRCEVIAFIRYNSQTSIGSVPRGCRICWGDLRDSFAVAEAAAGASAIFHLGGIISIPYSFDHPGETVAVNVGGALNVLEAARKAKCERILICSTSEVYGTAQYTLIDERHSKNPQSPYAASKVAADALALSYHASYGSPVVVARPFNMFGPRQSVRSIIPSLISQALLSDCIEVRGLSSIRDFTYISDTVAGMIAAIESEQAVGQEINLGTGSGVTIAALAEMVMGLIRTIPVISSEDRARGSGGVRQLVSDNSKARSLLNWKPCVDLLDGLNRTVEFVSAHPDLYAGSISKSYR